MENYDDLERIKDEALLEKYPIIINCNGFEIVVENVFAKIQILKIVKKYEKV